VDECKPLLRGRGLAVAVITGSETIAEKIAAVSRACYMIGVGRYRLSLSNPHSRRLELSARN